MDETDITQNGYFHNTHLRSFYLFIYLKENVSDVPNVEFKKYLSIGQSVTFSFQPLRFE